VIAAIDIAAADVAERRVVVAREQRAVVISEVPKDGSTTAIETERTVVASA
jgi:hypothetical protein